MCLILPCCDLGVSIGVTTPAALEDARCGPLYAALLNALRNSVESINDYAMIEDGIKSGKITKDTVLIEPPPAEFGPPIPARPPREQRSDWASR